MNLRYTDKKIRAVHNMDMALRKNNWRSHRKWFNAARKYHLLSIRNGEFAGVSMYDVDMDEEMNAIYGNSSTIFQNWPDEN